MVPVESLQSTESKGMDKNIHGDLGGDKTPNITFTLARYSGDGATVTAQGSLSINGVAKDVTLTGVLSAQAGGLGLERQLRPEDERLCGQSGAGDVHEGERTTC